MDQKNFTIGVLSTTAAILLVGLLLTTSRPEAVQAAGMTATGGDYVISVAISEQTDEEYVFVIDVPAKKMATYRFDPQKATIDLLQGIDLAMLQDQSGQPAAPPKPPGRRKP